ncbi:MAG: site-specific integrase [Prolixibacteraceae bacterium]|nr:site-specific integrase [Prolixibacteraceae bacterium]
MTKWKHALCALLALTQIMTKLTLIRSDTKIIKTTGSPLRIPILPKAWAIMDRYKNHPHSKFNGTIFPVISNQKLNSYLKEVADFCNITKNLTFHVARHTFATTVTLSNGVPIETVSKMLGHTSIKTTQIYARIVDAKISEDMGNLRSRLEEQSGQASTVDGKMDLVP